jgi:protein-disulfide isomerase
MSKQNRDNNRAEKAAAIRAAAARKQRNQRVAIIVGILVVLGAIIAAGTWAGTKSSKDNGDPNLSSLAVTAETTSLKVGPDSAPVKVTIYEDFLCPYCRQLEQSTREFLRDNAAKGKVQVEYRPVNILTQTTYSARAMNAWAAVLNNASPTAALKLHDLFYENQPYEQNADDTTDADIMKLVKQAGGENSAVDVAVKTQDQAFFTASATGATDVGLTGTPTVLINGKKLDNLSVDDIVSEIEKRVTAGK